MVSQDYIKLLEDVRDHRVPALIEEMYKLHKTKNAGYAGQSDDPWLNFRRAERIGLTALDGCMTRWTDKIARVENLFRDSKNEQVGESIEDTLMDLAAYSLIAICLLREQDGIHPLTS